MLIPTVIHSEKRIWNKNGKFWFESAEIWMGEWDTDKHKYGYETDEEGLAKMFDRGFNQEDYDKVKEGCR